MAQTRRHSALLAQWRRWALLAGLLKELAQWLADRGYTLAFRFEVMA